MELAKYCIDKTYEVIKDISDVIEPSAGNGAFSNQLNCKAYDIEPENENIIKKDYLKLELPYKQNRLVIGNPPYGERNALVVKFFKKSIEIADYISFILPLSQLNNNMQMYEFDLIHSEDIGEKLYSNRKIHCCFNIYKRPINGLNKKPTYKLKDIVIEEVRQRCRVIENYDIAICKLGTGCVGREIKFRGQYAHELYITVNNLKLKDKVIDLIRNTDWEKEICKGSSGQLNLPQWMVLRYLKEHILVLN